MQVTILSHVFKSPRWAAANETRIGLLMQAHELRNGHRSYMPDANPKYGTAQIRRAFMEILKRPTRAAKIAEACGLSEGTASIYLQDMEACGLVTSRKFRKADRYVREWSLK